MPSRRQVLAASVTALAVPSLVRAESSRVLKFIPQSDLTVIDPIWSTAYIARNHGYIDDPHAPWTPRPTDELALIPPVSGG